MRRDFSKRLARLEAKARMADELWTLPKHELERRLHAMGDSELDHLIAVLEGQLERDDAS